MKRGDIWTSSGGSDYASKPRPVVIVQAGGFAELASVTMVMFTTNETDVPLFRVPVEPDETNGLLAPSRLMADKIMTVPVTKLGRRVGTLAADDLRRLDEAIITFLGLGAGS